VDLITNLLTAMQKAPDTNFQRWLSNQIDLWSVRKKDWKEDGSDLMKQSFILKKQSQLELGERKHQMQIQCMHFRL
jgi:hypothetical protein